MRLIDADALLEEVEAVLEEEGRYAALMHIKNLILYAPTIDAAPVRRGEWKNESTFIDDVRGPRFVEIAQCNLCSGAGANTNFCPNCGADMRSLRDRINGEIAGGDEE